MYILVFRLTFRNRLLCWIKKNDHREKNNAPFCFTSSIISEFSKRTNIWTPIAGNEIQHYNKNTILNIFCVYIDVTLCINSVLENGNRDFRIFSFCLHNTNSVFCRRFHISVECISFRCPETVYMDHFLALFYYLRKQNIPSGWA